MHHESGYALKLTHVLRQKVVPMRDRTRCDQEVMRTNKLSCGSEVGPKARMNACDDQIDRNHWHTGQQRFDETLSP